MVTHTLIYTFIMSTKYNYVFQKRHAVCHALI